MKEIEANYSQRFLLPIDLEELVPRNHTARMFREFVDKLDLRALGFKMRESETGRPNYSANILLKICLYGLYNKYFSTRKLEWSCYNDLGMMWLAGLEHPDHNTLNRFLSGNRDAFKAVFKASADVAIKMNLVGLVLQALDGTKIAANASMEHALHKEKLESLLSRIDDAAEELLGQIESADAAEDGQEYLLSEELSDRERLREEVELQLKRLTEADTKHLSETDEDARVMICNKVKKFSYNAQAVVDDKCGIIVAADVVQDENDHHLLTGMIAEAEEITGAVAETTVADAGYYSGEELAKATQAGYEVLVSVPSTKKCKHISPQLDKSQFKYDEQTDTYTCPHGGILTFFTHKKERKQRLAAKKYRCRNFKNCPFRNECSTDKNGRTITVTYFETTTKAQKMKNNEPQNMAKIKKRKAIVEPLFGNIKHNFGFRQWNARGIRNVRAQWALICAVINLKKIFNQSKPISIAY